MGIKQKSASNIFFNRLVYRDGELGLKKVVYNQKGVTTARYDGNGNILELLRSSQEKLVHMNFENGLFRKVFHNCHKNKTVTLTNFNTENVRAYSSDFRTGEINKPISLNEASCLKTELIA